MSAKHSLRKRISRATASAAVLMTILSAAAQVAAVEPAACYLFDEGRGNVLRDSSE